MVLDAKSSKSNKTISLPKAFTRRDGSTESSAFNEVNWGEVVHKYMLVIDKRLRPSSFEKVITKAKGLAASIGNSAGGSRSMAEGMELDETDPYGQIVDLSDSDLSCKSRTFF